MNNSKDMSDRLETLLGHYFQSPEPDPGFLSQLKSSLLTSVVEADRDRSPKWTTINWRYALAASLLLIIGTIALIGPARVWAQIENWIAYLPGLGRVELSDTRVLKEPVFYSEDGITFRVEQFVASTDVTFLSIHFTGLPEDVLPSTETIYVQWDEPDGQRSGLHAWQGGMVHSTFPPCPSKECGVMQPDGVKMQITAGPLPPEVNQVQVEWLPYGVVPGAAPAEFWTIDISLTQITDENTLNFIQPGYSPHSAEDSQHGIKITVEDVFSDASGTVIDASIVGPDPASLPFARGVFLSTDTGYLSGETYFSNDMDMIGGNNYKVTPVVPRAITLRLWPIRWHFAPIDLHATQMTVEIESVILNYDTRYWFEIEIGQDPVEGTTIPLDVSLDVEGFPLHIYEARIVTVPESPPSGTNEVMAIEFALDSPLSAEGRKLRTVWFSQYDGPLFADQEFIEPVIDREMELSIGRLLLYPPIRDGKIKVAVDYVVLENQGPWVISWDVPQEAP